MSKTKKRLLNFFLGFIGFALLVGILFLAIAPGIPTEQLNSSGVSSRYLSLPNGRYLGDDVAGILSGEGIFEFDTGEVYTGSWQFNNMNGEGKLEGSLGNYSGFFKNSQRSGEGTFEWSNGDKYVGTWALDKMNGDGTLTTSSGATYTGSFINNVFVTGAIVINNDIAKYTILVSEGEVSDTINVEFNSGVTYNGEFEGTMISGKGVMSFPEIGEYDGRFEDGKRNGSGVFTWNDGDSYDGSWENDLMDGYGTYTFKDGTYLKGTFKDGALDGTYTYHNSDGDFKTTWEAGVCTAIVVK